MTFIKNIKKKKKKNLLRKSVVFFFFHKKFLKTFSKQIFIALENPLKKIIFINYLYLLVRRPRHYTLQKYLIIFPFLWFYLNNFCTLVQLHRQSHCLPVVLAI